MGSRRPPSVGGGSRARTRIAHLVTAIRWLLAGVVALAISAGGLPVALARASGDPVPLVVREVPGRHADAVATLRHLGGRVGLALPLIDGFAATLPAAAVAALRRSTAIRSVDRDAGVRLAGTAVASTGGTGIALSSLEVARAIGATDLWAGGITGSGVDVAVIDSGVAPVAGMRTDGAVISGPDLSFDRQAGGPAHLDTFGHGTHVASLIAGHDESLPAGGLPGPGQFSGIAPGARIVSIKVASAGGETDVSQVIAAIDWVVQHRDRDGFRVRVLNLSFGTDSAQDYRLDPLAYAAEVAWRHGIVVVVAAGNAGDVRARLADPAIDPFVIAVGAADPSGTIDPRDDTLPTWSSPGEPSRRPDLVAPGVAIPGLRVPGSILDQGAPGAAGSRILRGSGTSQASALVAGAAALLLQQRPNLKPDQVKALLTSAAVPLTMADRVAQGAGEVDVAAAAGAATPDVRQTWPRSDGTGSLDAARGATRLDLGGVPLAGELDIMGSRWDAGEWAEESEDADAWHDGSWNGHRWTGDCLCDPAWNGKAWTGLSWSGQSWSGQSWSGLSWSGLSWSGLSWSGLSWSGLSWSGLSWSGLSWSGLSWSGLSWSSLGSAGLSWSSTAWTAE